MSQVDLRFFTLTCLELWTSCSRLLYSCLVFLAAPARKRLARSGLKAAEPLSAIRSYVIFRGLSGFRPNRSRHRIIRRTSFFTFFTRVYHDPRWDRRHLSDPRGDPGGVHAARSLSAKNGPSRTAVHLTFREKHALKQAMNTKTSL